MSAVEAGVMLLVWGDMRSFLSHGARAGTLIVILILPFITCWSESERASRGLKPVTGQWRTLLLLEIGFLVSACLVLLSDRRNVFVLPDSDTLRYAGLLIFTAGVMIRVWAFMYLGRLFSVFLTIQEGHRLLMDNIYAIVRHPSYTGLLIRSVGWTLVFRSLFGLIACCALAIFLIRRIGYEERVLASEFGEVWNNYKRRTRWRLLPGVY